MVDARAQFDSGKALGFIFEVLRAKPGAFLVLCVLHCVIFAASAMIQYAITGAYGLESGVAMAGGDPDPAMAGEFFTVMLAAMLPGLVLFCLAEAWWLGLTMRGAASPLPLADMARVFLAFAAIWILGLVAFGVLGFVAALITTLAAMAAPVAGFLVGAVLGLVVLALLVAYCVRVSPIPALCVLERRFVFGAGFGGARRIFWSLFGAWFLVALALIALGLAGFVIGLVMPGPVGAVVGAAMNTADPAAQYEAMRAMFANGGTILVAFITLMILQAVVLPGYLLARGVASKAALHISWLREAERSGGEPSAPRPAPESAPRAQTEPRPGDEPLA